MFPSHVSENLLIKSIATSIKMPIVLYVDRSIKSTYSMLNNKKNTGINV